MEIPRFGRVVAEPHQYLIHLRNGRVVRSGQGASCFKWPSDSVTLIPTSIAKLSFCADQVTREKVRVEVSGLAVYRIVEPLLANRMIDVDVGRLTDILRDMFVGATRRIVAGLSLDECITHRKERVAAALLQEIAPVLSGSGAPEDTTHQGWGIVIDTIEIQHVRVLSEEVFQRLQAPYRESLALAALQAKEQVAEEQARLTFARRRAEEHARREIMNEEESRLAAERERQVAADRHAAALAAEALDAELERNRRATEAERERARAELETRRETAEMEAATMRLSRESRGELTERQLEEVVLVETLPRMAEALRGTFDTINLTSAQGSGGDLFAFLSAGIEHVARATRSAAASARTGRSES
ncbi:MAG: SPFH domain-containing protein [Polyangiaceae bacterium]|nr:SPFH domain-containing protein [Polyangiaceae bacterium]